MNIRISVTVATTIAIGSLMIALATPNSARMNRNIKQATNEDSHHSIADGFADGKQPEFASPLVATASPQHSASPPPTNVATDFDTFIERMGWESGYPSDRELADYEAELERLVEEVPAARLLLAERLSVALSSGEVLALYQLERAFSTTPQGLEKLTDVYLKHIKEGGQLDYYALQGASQFRQSISSENRSSLAEFAFDQMSRYSDFAQYGPAMAHLATEGKEGLRPAQYDSAVRLVMGRQVAARNDQERFFTAQALFRLTAGTRDAIQYADDALVRSTDRGTVFAVVDAFRFGRIPFDNAVASRVRAALKLPAFSSTEAAQAGEALDSAQKGPSG